MAKTAVTALVLLLVLARVDLHGVARSVHAASPLAMLTAFAVFLLMPALGGLRWWVALRGLGEPARLGTLTALFSAALVMAQILPSVAGDGVRVVLATRRGLRLAPALHSVFLERLFMVLTLLALAMATAPLLAARAGSAGPIWGCALLLACGLAGLALLMVADRIAPGLARWRPWRVLTRAAGDTRGVVLSRWGAALLLVSLCSNLMFVLGAWLLARALAVPATAPDFLAIMPLVVLASILPLSLGGWGVREGAMVALLGTLGVPAADALAVSLLFGVFAAISGLPGLLAWSLGRPDHSSGRPGIAPAP